MSTKWAESLLQEVDKGKSKGLMLIKQSIDDTPCEGISHIRK